MSALLLPPMAQLFDSHAFSEAYCMPTAGEDQEVG